MNGLTVLMIILLGIIGIMVWASIQEQKEWELYSTEHHCVATGEKKGQSTSGVGIGSKGSVSIVPVYIPSQVVYRCDDEEIVIR